jgi:hypothetical protein
VRTRTARETSRLLWRVAPITAAGILLLALAVRWRQGPPIVPLAALAGACLVWAVVAYVRRHVDRVSDQTAAAIDQETRLGGELRSAAWFASHNPEDPWAEFHLQRAADRLETIDFSEFYPPVRARRERVATGVMILAVLVLAVVFPQRPHAGSRAADTPLSATRKIPPIAVEGLPPELPQDLEDLLAAIESGTLTALRPGDAALLDTLKNLQSIKDPKALAALARAMAADRAKLDDQLTMKDLADRAKRDSTMTEASEVRDALDQLAKKLSEPDAEKDSAGFEKSDEAEPNGGVDLAGPSQSMRDTNAIAGIGMVAISKQDSAQSDAPPGVGAGGSSSSPNGGGTMPDIAQALRHEVVEANEDDITGDVHSDERRKTEHGTAAAGFTRGAAAQSDGSRAAAPPPVPETRRAGIQTYFTRKQ